MKENIVESEEMVRTVYIKLYGSRTSFKEKKSFQNLTAVRKVKRAALTTVSTLLGSGL